MLMKHRKIQHAAELCPPEIVRSRLLAPRSTSEADCEQLEWKRDAQIQQEVGSPWMAISTLCTAAVFFCRVLDQERARNTY